MATKTPVKSSSVKKKVSDKTRAKKIAPAKTLSVKPAPKPEPVKTATPARAIKSVAAPTPVSAPPKEMPIPAPAQIEKPKATPPPTKSVAAPAPTPSSPVAIPIAPRPPASPIEIPATLTVRDLAQSLKVGPIDIIRKLMASGIMANINQQIDFDTAALVADELGFKVVEAKPILAEPVVATLTSIPKKREYSEQELKQMVTRPPVVTVMGHVDHGKTTVLDAIRHADVAAGEAGGITQHIGAYQVKHAGKRITFLDTPGHEAFTAMRARGARATDIAIIVVAADDGVMPQTREAIDHARAAQVPIIVALNKIDMPSANPERVKQQLAELGLAVYGGADEVTVVPISAKQKTGIDELLENIIVVAELADLRANPLRPASGVIIESKLDKQKGPTATVLVNEGTLRVGDAVLISSVWGKVRAMSNDHGDAVKNAGPGEPVEITGLSDTPEAGEAFRVVGDEKIARARAETRGFEKRAESQKSSRALSLNDLFAQFQAGKVKSLNLIVKADVQGSLEPIVSSLEKLGEENIQVKMIHQGTGTVTRSDVMLAVASQGIVLAFNVGIESAAASLAENDGVDIREYSIIYKLIEDIDKALKGMLEPTYKEVLSGRAHVLQLFKVKKSTVAGLRVTQGKIARNSIARAVRGGTEIFKGSISSLKRFNEDVKEVAEGYECGIALEKFNDLRESDALEFFEKVRVS